MATSTNTSHSVAPLRRRTTLMTGDSSAPSALAEGPTEGSSGVSLRARRLPQWTQLRVPTAKVARHS